MARSSNPQPDPVRSIMKLPPSLLRRLQWFNLPTALLITFLQRSPVVRVVSAVEEMVTASPVGVVLKSVASAAAALGAMNSLAGATPLVPSSGTSSGITVNTGDVVTVAFTVNGTQTPPASWTVSGSFPPGLNFSGLTSTGIVDVSTLVMSGTPTTPGVYHISFIVWEGSGGTMISPNGSMNYSYTVTVVAATGSTAPSFTTQPSSQSVTTGANVTFTVGVSGNPTPTLQWQKNGTNITGATNSTLTLNNVQATDAATYAVVATNSAGTATSTGAVLTVSAAATAPAFTTQPATQNVTAGGTAPFTVAVTGNPTPTLQWKKNGTDIAGATNATLTLSNVQAADAATYTVVATNSAGTVTSSGAVLTVTASSVPAIVSQPQGHTIATGGSVVFTATVSGGGLSYQWKKNGSAIGGATSSQYYVSNAQASDAGSYTLTASNGSGTVTTNAAALAVTNTGDPGRLIAVSVRIVSGTDADVLIMGFVTSRGDPASTKQLLIRAAGPSLASFGVPNVMQDPMLQLIPLGASVPTLTNDNWGGDASITSVGNAVGAFPLASATSKDAAVLTTLNSGVYSVKVPGVGNTTGTVLAEIYDANPTTYSPSNPQLVDISARAQMANDNPLIAGFVIGGSTAKTVMIRAIGPGLLQFGLTGAMADPQVDLIPLGASTPILTNDNWGGSALITSIGNSVGAFTLTDAASKDAVMLVTLDPGVYTAKVTSVNNVNGIALIEIYDIP